MVNEIAQVPKKAPSTMTSSPRQTDASASITTVPLFNRYDPLNDENDDTNHILTDEQQKSQKPPAPIISSGRTSDHQNQKMINSIKAGTKKRLLHLIYDKQHQSLC